jgi:hypothetical protein
MDTVQKLMSVRFITMECDCIDEKDTRYKLHSDRPIAVPHVDVSNSCIYSRGVNPNAQLAAQQSFAHGDRIRIRYRVLRFGGTRGSYRRWIHRDGWPNHRHAGSHRSIQRERAFRGNCPGCLAVVDLDWQWPYRQVDAWLGARSRLNRRSRMSVRTQSGADDIYPSQRKSVFADRAG